MQTLLITGFGPFPTVADNPSGTLAQALDGQIVDGVRIIGRQLDTSWVRAWPALADLARDTRPDALVMLGVARRGRVEVERIAHNACLMTADCDGGLPTAPLLERGAPAILYSSLPWAELGIATSVDAGRYLCNALFYRAMHHLTAIPWRGFVHMPLDGTVEARALILRLARWIAARAAQSDGIGCSSGSPGALHC